MTVKGIKLYRFIAPDELYLSGDIYPPNKGFCVPPRCLPTGLLNVSLCQPQSKWRPLSFKTLRVRFFEMIRVRMSDHSDHVRSNEPMNPLWTRTHRFIWSTMIWVISDHLSWSKSFQRNAPHGSGTVSTSSCMFRMETNGETNHVCGHFIQIHSCVGIFFSCMYTNNYKHLHKW